MSTAVPAMHARSVRSSFSPYTQALHDQRYSRVARLMPRAEWDAHYDLIAEIEQLKQERDAIVLAHNYMRPEIFHGVADFQGDSLALAHYAARSQASVIAMCGVHFMAESAKLLSPTKKVLLPDTGARCSLADSITPSDIRLVRALHPGVPVVCYVNTTAAVKAECDSCCTSANAVEVVESMGSPDVILVPDEYLAAYVAARTSVNIIPWHGRCEVHERFTGPDVLAYRHETGAYILAHPECAPDVQSAADYVGSTSGMIAALERHQPKCAMLITECSMSDNVCGTFPHIQFLRPCNLCPHMRRITLQNIKTSLERMTPEVRVPDEIAEAARRATRRMLELR